MGLRSVEYIKVECVCFANETQKFCSWGLYIDVILRIYIYISETVMRVRTVKKIRRAKRNTYPYPTSSFHFRSLPDTGPLYFRDIYPGLSRRWKLNRGRRGKGRKKADEDGERGSLLYRMKSWQILFIDTLKFFEVTSFVCKLRNFYSMKAWSLHASPNIVDFEDLLKADKRTIATLKYIHLSSFYFSFAFFIVD